MFARIAHLAAAAALIVSPPAYAQEAPPPSPESLPGSLPGDDELTCTQLMDESDRIEASFNSMGSEAQQMAMSQMRRQQGLSTGMSLGSTLGSMIPGVGAIVGQIAQSAAQAAQQAQQQQMMASMQGMMERSMESGQRLQRVESMIRRRCNGATAPAQAPVPAQPAAAEIAPADPAESGRAEDMSCEQLSTEIGRLSQASMTGYMGEMTLSQQGQGGPGLAESLGTQAAGVAAGLLPGPIGSIVGIGMGIAQTARDQVQAAEERANQQRLDTLSEQNMAANDRMMALVDLQEQRCMQG